MSDNEQNLVDNETIESSEIDFKLELKIHKLDPEVLDPVVSTDWSACFDLHAFLKANTSITVYTKYNQKVKRDVTDLRSFVLESGDRALIPTGIIFDLPKGISMRIHPRSSMAFKHGLTLGNAEAVIDADYVDPTYVMLWNISQLPAVINNGERIAQGELVHTYPYKVVHVDKPEQKTNRTGGVGSTGK